MKTTAGIIVGVSVLSAMFAGCGSGSNEVTVTDDPQEIERLRPMMPPQMQGQQPAQPANGQAAPQQ